MTLAPTVMLSLAVPTSSDTSSCNLWPTATSKVWVVTLNPGCFAVRAYWPGCKATKSKSPVAEVTVERVTLVATLRISTATCAIGKPVGSFTVPTTDANSNCAKAGGGNAETQRERSTDTVHRSTPPRADSGSRPSAVIIFVRVRGCQCAVLLMPLPESVSCILRPECNSIGAKWIDVDGSSAIGSAADRLHSDQGDSCGPSSG